MHGKRILVTGAGGSIGSALARQLTTFAPEHLLLLDAAESNLYEVERALRQATPSLRQTAILGSVTQPALLREVFERYQPHIVYHAAAFKHVPLGEQNPFAMIENNVLGTRNLLQAAERCQTEQCILLSTDKAADPVSMMGASKRIAELMMLANASQTMRTAAVRLGNVLGSEGSVVPLFCDQIRQGGPVTVTHPEVRRYFLTTDDAVTLLLAAASTDGDDCLLVPELGEPVLLHELARHLIALMASPSKGDVSIAFTQLRAGDKLCETLLATGESFVAPSDGKPLRALKSPGLSASELKEILDELDQACQHRSIKQLLAAVLRAVPTYQPSTLITSLS